MKKMNVSAVAVNRMLIAGIILLGAGSIYGCYLLQGFLSQRALETNHAKIDVNMSREEIQRMTTLQAYLLQHADKVSDAASVVAQSKEYQYQDQIVRDLNEFATKAGVRVLGFDFPADAAVATPAAGGLKTIKATITLQNPVKYRSFLTFLQLIEQNLTKMQITEIGVTPVDDDPTNINSPSIGLEVYVQ